jgi:hypothetical protein
LSFRAACFDLLAELLKFSPVAFVEFEAALTPEEVWGRRLASVASQ